MTYGFCHLSLVPLRKAPDHKSELTSQLLFGETFQILDEDQGFGFIRCYFDDYNGWIDLKQITIISEKIFSDFNNNNQFLALDPIFNAKFLMRDLYVLMGSNLPFYNKGQFNFLENKYTYQGAVNNLFEVKITTDFIKELCLTWLDVPYLWGGRTILGIDCSGFTQIIFKMLNITLKRDAFLQATQGETLYFIHEAKAGDLAFFDNEDGQIVHVGILLNNNQIIHAHGKVRIDPIDHKGIYNSDLKKYTHNLRLLKRYFQIDS